mmetsp:Transcript_11608/g.17584  ORF Transcript_11608/g.17584 Transcript_11608/m.17584 type:complete len:137 (-) Transcript_11608:298-708(-)
MSHKSLINQLNTNNYTTYSETMTITKTTVLLSALSLLISIGDNSNVDAAFGSRRHYHSYHHISQSSRTGKKASVSAPSVPSSQEEIEHILRKAAQIRRRAALLDSDEGYSTHPQNEVSHVSRQIREDIRSGVQFES